LKKIFSFLFTYLFIGYTAFAQEDKIPDAPNPPKLVNNFSKELPNFLSSSEQQALENKLVEFNNATSNQIVIVIVDDLAGFAPYEYASKLGNKWGVGQAKYKNGIVVLIKPTESDGNKKAIFISPSGGLQGIIPDAATSRIIDNEIVPQFKQKNFYEGLDRATNVLMSLAKSEYSYSDYGKKKKNGLSSFFVVAIVLFVIVIMMKQKGGRGGGYTIDRRGGRFGGAGWFLLGSLLGSGGRGGGGFGGGGGGGFGGFGGGGGFNGGGSGGSW